MIRRRPPGEPRPARPRLLPAGLRARLVVVFLLVAALSALTAAALTYRQARAGILERAQDDAVHDLRGQVDSLAPDLPAAPGEADLRALALQLDRAGGSRDWRTAAAYRTGPPVPAADRAPVLPGALRTQATAARTALVQRFHTDGIPWLAVALPVDAQDAGPSGLVVYASFSLAPQERDVSALVAAARAGVLPVVVLSVIPALFAARRVLRPVRQLRSAAEQMADGALETRIEVRGEGELADLGRTFNTMAATLQEDAAALRAMEAKARRFASDVSHELRTPLAAMAAVTGVLAEDSAAGELAPETAEALELVVDETHKLVRLVEDLMEISRFDAGAAVLAPDDVDLGRLVHKTLELRHWSERVTVDVPGGLRARLDPRRIDVVLANLVGNALRHGGPDVPVAVRARTAGGTLVLTVADGGPGIPEAVLPHVFDRFVKGDPARTRSEGSGLGLAIAAENARLHGGTLTAANGPEGGAVFTLTVPLREDVPQ
ncbi:HAMP domain-containing sensor histidine kinase [Streptomyces sp. NPDC089919]|uniref:HAMP domain-containing sensor histidine kinase n=1 Tax=Streptomyces sp. NPDC089919 TaxID=3155188 RepID=UPI003422444C